MANYPFHNLLTIFGDLWDGDDQVDEWAINLRLCGPFATAAKPADNPELADAITGWWNGTAMKSITASGTRILGFKHNAIGTDGTFETPEAPNTHTFPTPLDGNAANTRHMPPQVSLVASLTTPKVGKSYRGRIYLPCPAGTISNRFYVNSSTPGTIATTTAQFLSALNAITEASNGTRVCIVSSKGFYTPVTGVRVGSVYDTQRRRSNALFEQYTSAAV